MAILMTTTLAHQPKMTFNNRRIKAIGFKWLARSSKDISMRKISLMNLKSILLKKKAIITITCINSFNKISSNEMQ